MRQTRHSCCPRQYGRLYDDQRLEASGHLREKEWASGWLEWVDEWASGWVSEWMSECVREWMWEWVSEWMNVREWLLQGQHLPLHGTGVHPGRRNVLTSQENWPFQVKYRQLHMIPNPQATPLLWYSTPNPQATPLLDSKQNNCCYDSFFAKWRVQANLCHIKMIVLFLSSTYPSIPLSFVLLILTIHFVSSSSVSPTLGFYASQIVMAFEYLHYLDIVYR